MIGELIKTLDLEIERLTAIRELALALVEPSAFAPAKETTRKRRGTRVLSEEARHKMSLAQKRRWAKHRRNKQ